MERDDVDVLVIGHVGSDRVDALLYDPMPGGSGLLEQACERWADVVAAALVAVEGCPGVCQRACIDCLHTFRNAYFHWALDRHVAAELGYVRDTCSCCADHEHVSRTYPLYTPDATDLACLSFLPRLQEVRRIDKTRNQFFRSWAHPPPLAATEFRPFLLRTRS